MEGVECAFGLVGGAKVGVAEFCLGVNALDAHPVVCAMAVDFSVVAGESHPAAVVFGLVAENHLAGGVPASGDVHAGEEGADFVLLQHGVEFAFGADAVGDDEPALAAWEVGGGLLPFADDEPEVVHLEVDGGDEGGVGLVGEFFDGVLGDGDGDIIEAFGGVPRLGEGGIDDAMTGGHDAAGFAPCGCDGGKRAVFGYEAVEGGEVVSTATGAGVGVRGNPACEGGFYHGVTLGLGDFAAALLAFVVGVLGDEGEVPFAVCLGFVFAFTPPAESAVAVFFGFGAEFEDDELLAVGAWDVEVSLVGEEEFGPDSMRGGGGGGRFDDEGEGEVFGALFGVFEGSGLEVGFLAVFVDFVHLEESDGPG